jgi:hypothetical protein
MPGCYRIGSPSIDENHQNVASQIFARTVVVSRVRSKIECLGIIATEDDVRSEDARAIVIGRVLIEVQSIRVDAPGLLLRGLRELARAVVHRRRPIEI